VTASFCTSAILKEGGLPSFAVKVAEAFSSRVIGIVFFFSLGKISRPPTQQRAGVGKVAAPPTAEAGVGTEAKRLRAAAAVDDDNAEGASRRNAYDQRARIPSTERRNRLEGGNGSVAPPSPPRFLGMNCRRRALKSRRRRRSFLSRVSNSQRHDQGEGEFFPRLCSFKPNPTLSIQIVLLSAMAAFALADKPPAADPYAPPPPPPPPAYRPAPYQPPAYKPAPYKPNPYKEEKLPPQPFAYQYGVRDDYTGADFDKKEEQDAYGNLNGEYRVNLPDGRVQIVTYRATGEEGFVADVR